MYKIKNRDTGQVVAKGINDNFEKLQEAIDSTPIKHLGVFDNMQQGYNAAAADGICDNDKLSLLFFTTAESIRNNCLIIQSVNRYHHITTQTMLMEGSSAKSWTRRIVLGGNKSVGDWQQLGSMVNTFHLSGTKLCGRLPSGTEVQLVDLAPIIPESTGGGFELEKMYTNSYDIRIWKGQIGTLGGNSVMRAVVDLFKGGSYLEGYGFSTTPLDFFYHVLGSETVSTSAAILSISGTAKDGYSKVHALSIDEQGSSSIAWISSFGPDFSLSSPHLFVESNTVTRVTITIDYIESFYSL